MLHNDVFTFVARNIGRALGLLIVVLLISTNPMTARANSNVPYLVKDIRAHQGANPAQLTALQDQLLFTVSKGTKSQLWRSDGTANGTVRVQTFARIDSGGPFIVAGRGAYFIADDGIHGGEPWRSNGKALGTKMIGDYKPGKKGSGAIFVNSAGRYAYFMLFPHYSQVLLLSVSNKSVNSLGGIGAMPGGVAIQKTLYFAGGYGSDTHLWKSDGTQNGTSIVKEINSSGGSNPNSFTANENLFWFFATDDTGQRGLWQSDGTGDGTQLIKELGDPGQLGIVATANVQAKLFFVIRNNTTQQFELWTSDSSEGGTNKIQDIGPIAQNANAPQVTAFGALLAFVIDDGVHGRQLWTSDGTADGTDMLTTLGTSPNGVTSKPIVVNNTLLFAANDGVHGSELWQSDGTPEGTQMVADINPQNSADPQWLTRVNETLFFTADDGTHGRELWAYQP